MFHIHFRVFFLLVLIMSARKRSGFANDRKAYKYGCCSAINMMPPQPPKPPCKTFKIEDIATYSGIITYFGKEYKKYTLNNDFILTSCEKLILYDGTLLEIPNGLTLINEGLITSNDSVNSGLLVYGTFINRGSKAFINLGGILNGGTFTNESSASIHVTDIGNDGTFTNESYASIHVTGIVNNGYNGTFTNTGFGTNIEVNNEGGDSQFINKGTFINESNASIILHLFYQYNTNNTQFINQSGASITIVYFDNQITSIITNTDLGTTFILTNQSDTPITSENQGTINNQNGAIFYINGNSILENSGVFNNSVDSHIKRCGNGQITGNQPQPNPTIEDGCPPL